MYNQSETYSSLQCLASSVVVLELSCPMADGILVRWLGTEPMSPALEGEFLTTGPPGKSQQCSIFDKHLNDR